MDLILFIKAFLILIALFSISIAISKLITKNRILKNENVFLRLVVESYLGTLFIVSFWALIRCFGVSFLAPVAVTICVVYYRFYKNNSNQVLKYNYSIFNLIIIGLTIILTLVAVVFLFAPFDSKFIITNNIDFGYYSSRAKHIFKYRIETIFFGDNVIDENCRSLYHYVDLWLIAFINKVFDFNAYYSFLLVVKTYISALFVLTILGLLKKSRAKVHIYFFSITILFVGASLFFINNNSDNWKLQFDYYPSIINYHGGLFACIHIGISFLLIYILKEKINGYLLLSFMGAINPILIPIPILFFAFKLLSCFFFKIRKKKTLWVIIRSPYVMFLIISIFIYFFSITLTGNNDRLSNMSFVLSIKVICLMIFKNYFEIIICNSIFSFGFAYLCFSSQKRNFIWDIFFLLNSCIIVNGVLFESYRSDIWQMKIICSVGTLSLFGYFGFLMFLNKLKPFSSSLILFIVLSSSLYLSIYNKNYAFGVGSIYQKKNIVRINKSQKLDFEKWFSNKRNGFAILKNGNEAYINMPAGISVTEVMGIDQIAYRLNFVASDSANSYKKLSLKYFIQSVNPISLPCDSLKLYKLIVEKKLNWVYTDNINYFMPDYLKSKFPNKYSFGDVIIYTK